MKKLIALSATLLISAAPFAAQAQETGGGCGLGAMVLEGKSGKGAQIAAALLNTLIIPNTFFMTTGGGLMGCDPTQTVKNEEVTEIFVASNMDQLSTEVAQGGGEYLTVLADLMGIADEDKAAFHVVAQQNYDALFLTDGDAKRVIESIETAMLNDSSLSKYAVN